MRVERLVESRSSVVRLSDDEAAAVMRVGRRMASGSRGWGRPAQAPAPSLIECVPYGAGTWNIRVANAVGVVRVGGVQLTIEPKVPLDHLLYLFVRSGAIPKLDSSKAQLSSAADLWPLVAHWYVGSLERLLQTGLSSGYRESSGHLAAARGRIRPAATASLLLSGRPQFDCEFEDFDSDIPLNRVLLAAARRVAASTLLDSTVRARARRAAAHIGGVGEMRTSDLLALPERHTARYVEPHSLAIHVLSALGRTMDVGDQSGFSFLIRTPDMVEEAVRRVVAEALADEVGVTKTTMSLVGSGHSMTPDLDFGGAAVGDVKYKLWDGDWPRADLYQLVAFATAFGVAEAVRVGFSSTPAGWHHVQVGGVRLSTCNWRADPAVSPNRAEELLADRMVHWWKSHLPSQGTTSSAAGSVVVSSDRQPDAHAMDATPRI